MRAGPAKSTFIRIFSYGIFLSLGILLLTLCILYFSFRNIVTREIHNQSMSLLAQTQSIFNSLHEWLIPSFRQIRSEPAISALINSRTLKRTEISPGIDRLLEVLSAYYLVDSIYVYNSQTRQYVSTINGYEGLACSDDSLPGMLQDIRRYGVYRYLPRKMTYRIRDSVWRPDSAAVDSLDVLSIVVGDMPDAGPAMQGALIVNISVKKIIDNFFPAQAGSTSRLIIVDRDGKVLAHPDPKLFGTNYSRLPAGKDEGIFTDTYEGRRYLVSYTTHPAWGWRFINTIGYEEIFRNLTDFLIVAAVVFVLLMLLSVCLSYIGSWKIYSPISWLEKNQVRVKQEVIRGLVLGELDPDSPENYRQYLKDELAEGPFLIAVLRLDNYSRLMEKLPSDDISRFFFVLKEQLSRFMPVPNVVLQPQRDHVCLIAQGHSPAEVKAALAGVQETVTKQLALTFTIGMSDVFPRHDSFHEEYDACLAATQFRFRFGGNTIIRTRDVDQVVDGEYAFPEERIHVLFQELAMGKVARVEQVVDEILDGVRGRGFEDYSFMVQSIVYQTSKQLEKLNHSLKGSVLTLRGLLQMVRSSETLEDLKNRLMETYSLVAEIGQKKQGHRLEELARGTQTYIEQNFQDVTLCTESIADVMGVTASYVRFVYKNTFGGSLAETLNSLRLKYCEDQLAQTRLPVKKIYQTAGFGNYSYFFTLFKKNTGLTPNQYRFQRLSNR
jgi:AraC-like DNA-binding protein